MEGSSVIKAIKMSSTDLLSLMTGSPAFVSVVVLGVCRVTAVFRRVGAPSPASLAASLP